MKIAHFLCLGIIKQNAKKIEAQPSRDQPSTAQPGPAGARIPRIARAGRIREGSGKDLGRIWKDLEGSGKDLEGSGRIWKDLGRIWKDLEGSGKDLGRI